MIEEHDRRYVLEARLHEMENEFLRIRQQMTSLRGLERTPERQARLDELTARFDALRDEWLDVYREWNTLED
ncbi:MAG: hypothetical protein HY329_27725 [Chloroflexi bacterium]|nr:hypothetical protein [Chloroflexota bacterium]